MTFGRCSYRLVALIGLLSLPAQAQEVSEPLDPAGDWRIERDAESCRLLRAFGSGDVQTTLYFNAYGLDDSYRVTLTGPAIPRNNGKAQIGRLAFGAEAELASNLMIANRIGEDGMLSFHLIGRNAAFGFFRGWAVPGGFADPSAAASMPADMSRLTIETPELGRLALNLGEMGGALTELDQCKRDLVASWGHDPAQQERITVPAELNNARQLLLGMRMPEASVMNHVSIIAQLRLLVDAEGRATQCVVQSPSLNARAQSGLCRPLTNGTHFIPARDANGNAVPSLYRMHYTYFIFD